MQTAEAHLAGVEHFLHTRHEGNTDAVSELDQVKTQFVFDFPQHLIARGVATGIPAGGKREHSLLPNDAYNAAATSGVGELVIAAGVSFKRPPIRLRMKSAAAP